MTKTLEAPAEVQKALDVFYSTPLDPRIKKTVYLLARLGFHATSPQQEEKTAWPQVNINVAEMLKFIRCPREGKKIEVRAVDPVEQRREVENLFIGFKHGLHPYGENSQLGLFTGKDNTIILCNEKVLSMEEVPSKLQKFYTMGYVKTRAAAWAVEFEFFNEYLDWRNHLKVG